MKRIICSFICTFLVIGSCACSQNKNDDRSDRKIELTYSSSQPSEIVSEDEPPEIWEPSSDPLESFEYISKLPEEPDYIKTNPRLYASLLQNMMDLYYSGVLNGRINSDSVSFRYSGDKLPSADSDAESRRSAARYCTVGGALEYFGIDCKNYMKYYEIYNGCLPYFCYDSDGDIFAVIEKPLNKVLNLTSFDQALYFIYRSANKDNVEKNAQSFAASEIDNAIKKYYYGIKNGTIDSSVSLPRSGDRLPEKDASQEERDRLANEATISGAIEYAGYYTPLYPMVSLLGYNSKTGKIVVMDHTEHSVLSISSPKIKLGEIFAGTKQ